jgi:alpha-L-fucosidase
MERNKLFLRRRDLLYNAAAAGLSIPLTRLHALVGSSQPASTAGGSALARPSLNQQKWQDLEFGMFVHFAPNTWQNVESDNLSTPLSAIDPAKLDTDQWVDTALALGARYIVFVAKHQGGFCMWQTRTTEYSIRNTPWKGGKGDVLAEIAGSCRRRGLPLGVYVCPRDDHFGAGTGGICKTPELQRKYDAMYREQLTEVWSRYGELVEIWFDGSTITPVGDLLKRYQPNAMVFQGPEATIRWVGNEDGFAPYPCWNGIDAAEARTGVATALDGDPNGTVWLPNEADVSIRRPDWFWSTTNARKVLSVDQLLSVYYRSVGRGAQLLLNIPADRDGLLPQPDCSVAAAFGSEIRRRFSRPVASTHGSEPSLVLTLDHPSRIDTIVVEEEIGFGERVRAYKLEGKIDGAWRLLGEGSAIGHKRIQPVPPEEFIGVRLRITQSAGDARIRRFAVFDTGVAPPSDWDAASTLWAPDLVGRWANGAFSINLTERIHVAGQYALRFQPERGAVTSFRDEALEIGGISDPALLHASPTQRNELLLDITGLDRTIRVHGRVEGAETGSILLERR